MDRLIEAIEAKQNPSVVGLDPSEALVPAELGTAHGLWLWHLRAVYGRHVGRTFEGLLRWSGLYSRTFGMG